MDRGGPLRMPRTIDLVGGHKIDSRDLFVGTREVMHPTTRRDLSLAPDGPEQTDSHQMTRLAWHLSAAARRHVAVAFVRAAVAGRRARRSSRYETRAGANVTSMIASRIVSIGGAVTEILYALGSPTASSQSIRPASIRPRRSSEAECRLHARALSAEGVLGLNPSAVLAIDGAGPKEAVAVLEAGRRAVRARAGSLHGGGNRRKDQDGRGHRRRARSRRMSREEGRTRSRGARATARTRLTQPQEGPVRHLAANGKPMVAGRNTAADGDHGSPVRVNAIDAYEGYKQMSDEAMIAASPDTCW